jgi:hypothetical protein
MIRNAEEAVITLDDDDNLYVRIPKSIVKKSGLEQGFSITLVAGTKSIKRMVNDGEAEHADFGFSGNIGSILLNF